MYFSYSYLNYYIMEILFVNIILQISKKIPNNILLLISMSITPLIDMMDAHIVLNVSQPSQKRFQMARHVIVYRSLFSSNKIISSSGEFIRQAQSRAELLFQHSSPVITHFCVISYHCSHSSANSNRIVIQISENNNCTHFHKIILQVLMSHVRLQALRL